MKTPTLYLAGGVSIQYLFDDRIDARHVEIHPVHNYFPRAAFGRALDRLRVAA